MDEQLKELIRQLCNQVEEVCDNGDWPTEDEDTLDRVNAIRDGIAHL